MLSILRPKEDTQKDKDQREAWMPFSELGGDEAAVTAPWRMARMGPSEARKKVPSAFF